MEQKKQKVDTKLDEKTRTNDELISWLFLKKSSK